MKHKEKTKKIKKRAEKIISNASQLLTCDSKENNPLGIIGNGWLAIADGKIIGVGSKKDIKEDFDYEEKDVIDATEKVVLPGFVDCHTHVVFGGSRVEEYSAKLTTKDPEALRKMGIKTGIMVSVNQTRNATFEDLYLSSKKRLEWMIKNGTTTVESKSGYGLNLATEIKQLEVGKKLNQDLALDIIPTFLGAHGWPDNKTKDQYIDELVLEMIPEIKSRNLANFCDVWCDEGHYTKNDSRRILSAGADAGMKLKIHADAYSYIGASDLAAEMEMTSADHLNFTPLEIIKKMKKSNVTGVILPGTDFAVKHPKPVMGRNIIDVGLTIGLGTNCCPGCWNVSMAFTMTLACKQHGLSTEEAILAATIGSSTALNLDYDRGSLEVGKRADVQIWDTNNYKDIVYHYGENLIEKVMKNGEVIVG